MSSKSGGLCRHFFWRKKFMLPLDTIKFCMRCGHSVELRHEAERLRPVCPRCGWVYYFAPQVAGAAILTRAEDEKILLVQRGEDPGKGLWGLPGGFVELGETVQDALTREILEETGYAVEVGALVGVWSFFNAVKKLAGIVLIYETRVTGGTLQIASDSTAAEWVTYAQAMEFPLAFETHRDALRVWHARRDVMG
jgi:ADP-ribose pyrophosphatase YjhB (NUDIX family)